jgi:hypothetical protein
LPSLLTKIFFALLGVPGRSDRSPARGFKPNSLRTVCSPPSDRTAFTSSMFSLGRREGGREGSPYLILFPP